MEKARPFSLSPALSSAQELSGDCIIAILKPTCQSSWKQLLERPRTQQRAQSSLLPGSGIHPQLAWQGSSAPSTWSSGQCHGWHPAFIPSSPRRVDQGLVLSPCCSLVGGTGHGGVDLSCCFCGGSEFPAPWERGDPPTWGCSMASERCMDWVNHGENHFMEEKHILPTHPHPPQVRKLRVKPITGMVQRNMHSHGARGRCVLVWGGRPSLTPLSGLTPSSLPFPLAALGSVPAPFPTRAGSMSTLAGGGQWLVDGGLEAAHVLHRGTVCFHWLHVLVQDGKDLVVQDLILPDPVGHLLQGLEGWWGRETEHEGSYVIWPARK